jgi:hypothetical protein
MKIFYILSFILLITIPARSQTRGTPTEPVRTVKFYPNPAVSQITFDFEQGYDKDYSFQIFNFVGKKMYESPFVNSRTIVNVSDFYRGMYIFQLKDKSGRVIDSGKFQVAH